MDFRKLSDRFIAAFNVKKMEPEIAVVGIKFVLKGEKIPEGFEHDDIPVPWCGAVKFAAEGERIAITKDNIGCPAGAIALGLVDANDPQVLSGHRKYTAMMEQAASPRDFTEGFVYACKGSEHMEFALFGASDSGRYKSLEAARNAIKGMAGINRELVEAVLAFPPDEVDLVPDVVLLGLQPKQALRVLQGYCYESGQRAEFNTIGIRGVCADVTAYPYIKNQINASFFCLGARALSGWEGDRLALGVPYEQFAGVVQGMEESAGGFPYAAYPK